MGLNIYKSDKSILKKENDIEYYIIDRLEDVQKEMLHLLSIVDKICIENNIDYWIDGGSLIGAIRHNGFIPWDDDIDISLCKCDYIKLLTLLYDYSKKSNDTYLYFSPEETEFHCCNFFASKKNLYARVKGGFGLMPVKLDIRPVNVFAEESFNLDENNKYRDLANIYLFGKSYLNKTTNCHFNLEEKYKFFNFYNSKYGLQKPVDKTIFVHPYFEYTKPIVFYYEDIFPVKRMLFEDIMVSVPNKIDNFLSYFYGNYMELPKMEQRSPYAYEFLEIKGNKRIDELIEMIILQNKGQYNAKNIYHLWKMLKLLGIKKFSKILYEKIMLLLNK